VVLGGGVFQNDRLTTELGARLTTAGLRVFLPRQVPIGDGGIALGQVLVANATKERS
jgi:hydrogenase maturation protein HypF